MLPQVFIEAAFSKHMSTDLRLETIWHDKSTDAFFVFESKFGIIQLRKRHSYPKTFAYAVGEKLYAGYGNDTLALELFHHDLQFIDESVFYNDEFLIIEADARAQTVHIGRDSFSTLPLFFTTDNASLFISNHYERVCEFIDRSAIRVDKLAVVQVVSMIEIHHMTSLIANIFSLQDRQRLEWAGNNCDISHPPHSSATRLKGRGNPREFRKHLETTFQEYWERYNQNGYVGSELSGGLDSSAIVGYLCDRGYPLITTTIEFTGSSGVSQKLKLRDLASRFPFENYSIKLDMDRHCPLISMVETGDWHPRYITQDPHDTMVSQMASHLASLGVEVVFRGVGGDELFDDIFELSTYAQASRADRYRYELSNTELPEYMAPSYSTYFEDALVETGLPEPIPLTSQTVAWGATSGNNMYLDYNVWPVMPLADPQLYLYCQTLPRQFRQANRDIMRAYLKARSFPESVYVKGPSENSGDFLGKSMSVKLSQPFYNFMQDSVLARSGIIDARKASEIWKQASKNINEDTTVVLLRLYFLLVAEITLQSFNIRQV